jgi:uncharacterized protein DUF3105
MPTLLRTFPVVLTAALAFAAPFIAVACSDSPSISGTSGATTSGEAAASSSGSGGATAAVTSSASVTATGTGGGAASSTSGTGGATASSGSSGGAGGSGGAMSDAGDAGDTSMEPDSPLSCGTIVTQYAVDPSPHINQCFPVVYSSNPPTSGPHYPIWAAFQTYTTPVPRGFTVHDLEHGAIVISYKCAGGCAAELAALQAYVDARPADPLCAAPVKSRITITPDPLLDVPFAAAAWGFALTSQCFDLPALGAFIDAHYAMGPENFCVPGFDPTAPDAGVPADCGEPADAGAGPG